MSRAVVALTRALLRLERKNLFGGRGGREGGREGGGMGLREGGRDDCYTYSNRYVQQQSNDTTIYYIKLQFSLSVCLYPPFFFDTIVGPQPNLAHIFGRYGTHSQLKKLTHLTPGVISRHRTSSMSDI